MVDQIQANYEALEEIQKELTQLEEKLSTLRGRVLVAYEPIRDSGWQGAAADKFKEEMDSRVLFQLGYLAKAMNQTGVVIGKVANKFREAEEAVRSNSPERAAGG